MAIAIQCEQDLMFGHDARYKPIFNKVTNIIGFAVSTTDTPFIHPMSPPFPKYKTTNKARRFSFPWDMMTAEFIYYYFISPRTPTISKDIQFAHNFAVDRLLSPQKKRNGTVALYRLPAPPPPPLTLEFVAQSRQGCRRDSWASFQRAGTGPVSGASRNRWRRETLWPRASDAAAEHRAASSCSPPRAVNCAGGRKT